MSTTRLWRSSLRSILPLFRYSTHAFLRNSAASEKTPAKLAEAGQVRAEVTWHYSPLLTRYLHTATLWNSFLKTSSFCIGALPYSLQKDCLCQPRTQRNYIIYGLSVVKFEYEVSFEPFRVLEWPVNTMQSGDQLSGHKQATGLPGRPPHWTGT
jgi:hypothetical protein